MQQGTESDGRDPFSFPPLLTEASRRILVGRLPSPRVASEDCGDTPRISDEEAVVFTLLHLDTGHLHPLSNRGDLLGFFEYDGPVLQAHPALRGGRYTRSAPEVETEVGMGAAGRHERGGARHEGH